eukprot:GHVU01229951.1.p4 GENE.GHVU01229951.1~~GHVU01229951.1.p4  ORF type:complete len:113 (-),score=19.93 GHVU01229951.1:1047-1385(-)
MKKLWRRLSGKGRRRSTEKEDMGCAVSSIAEYEKSVPSRIRGNAKEKAAEQQRLDEAERQRRRELLAKAADERADAANARGMGGRSSPRADRSGDHVTAPRPRHDEGAARGG